MHLVSVLNFFLTQKFQTHGRLLVKWWINDVVYHENIIISQYQPHCVPTEEEAQNHPVATH